MRSIRRLVAVLGVVAVVAAACGDDDTGGSAAQDRASIVVTTNILGDVVSSLLGDAADVTTVMPAGASPHDFQASARQAQAMREADLLVVNGAGFEEGLLDVIEAAEGDGVPVYEAISAVDVLDFGADHADEDHADEDHADEDHADEDHADEDHADEDDHEHSGVDPHFFTDPARMATAAEGVLDAVIEHVPGLDAGDVRATAAVYIAQLESLDAEVEATLAGIPGDRRVLVTNHEVFGYFADRYGFEVVGTVIPSGSTNEGASAQQLAALVDVIGDEGVGAIFADTSSPVRLAETLAAEVGEVEVVELYSESLGDSGSGAETYPAMIRTNAELIARSLG